MVYFLLAINALVCPSELPIYIQPKSPDFQEKPRFSSGLSCCIASIIYNIAEFSKGFFLFYILYSFFMM